MLRPCLFACDSPLRHVQSSLMPVCPCFEPNLQFPRFQTHENDWSYCSVVGSVQRFPDVHQEPPVRTSDLRPGARLRNYVRRPNQTAQENGENDNARKSEVSVFYDEKVFFLPTLFSLPISPFLCSLPASLDPTSVFPFPSLHPFRNYMILSSPAIDRCLVIG